MAKKLYVFHYNGNQAEVVFNVELDKFTPEMAYTTLNYFTWDYDEEADPIDEVMKKYALAILTFIKDSEYIHNPLTVRTYFENEGYGKVDGSIGITLLSFKEFQFEEDDLEMEVHNG